MDLLRVYICFKTTYEKNYKTSYFFDLDSWKQCSVYFFQKKLRMTKNCIHVIKVIKGVKLVCEVHSTMIVYL